MDSKDSNPATAAARRFERRCDSCNEYSVHMRHPGLVYGFFTDAQGVYHRHIAYCPDLGLRERSKMVH